MAGQHPAFYAALKIKGALSERDVAQVAVHEAGHALLYAALRPLPDYVRASIARQVGLDDDLGHVTQIVYPHELEALTFLRWEMRMLLAGQVAETLLLDAESVGPVQDLAAWHRAARTHLATHPHGVLFFCEPANAFEQASNERQLERELIRQRAEVRAVLVANIEPLRELAACLAQRDLTAEDLRPILIKVALPQTFPRPDLHRPYEARSM